MCIVKHRFRCQLQNQKCFRDELSRRKIIRDHSRMNTVMDPCGGDRRREREEEGESEIVLDGVLGLSAECEDNNSVLFPSSNDST